MSDKNIGVTISGPPNLKIVKCCSVCRYADHGYEGEIECDRYPSYVIYGNESKTIYDGNYHSTLCDSFEPDKTHEKEDFK